MTNILAFPGNLRDRPPPDPQYREPTPDEYTQLLECLARMRCHAITLQQELESTNKLALIRKSEASQ